MWAFGYPGGWVTEDEGVERAPEDGGTTETKAVAVTHQSPDGAVSVTVGSTGALVDVACSDRIRTMPPRQVAQTFRDCVQAAQARADELRRAAAPTTSDAPRRPTPPSGAPEPDGGPKLMAIGTIEDGAPHPRGRHVPVRPRPAAAAAAEDDADDADDWDGRTIMS